MLARRGRQGSRGARRRSRARAVLSDQPRSRHQRRADARTRRLCPVPRAQARHRAARRAGHPCSRGRRISFSACAISAPTPTATCARKRAPRPSCSASTRCSARERASKRGCKGDGEVRGRLDGVTPRTLLYAISQLRPRRPALHSRRVVSLRGRSCAAARRRARRAPRATGRSSAAKRCSRRCSVCARDDSSCPRRRASARGTLEGDLDSQMEAPVAHARAALRLLGGTRLLEVHRVDVAVDRVIAYLAATPEPARSLITRLGQRGFSPRSHLWAARSLPLSSKKCSAIWRRTARSSASSGAGDTDLLGPALDQELSAIRRGGTPSNRPPQDVKVVVVAPRGAEKTKTIEPREGRYARAA